MQVGPDRPADAAALEAALAVVAEACDDPSQRFCAVIEVRAARVVLEARERSLDSGSSSHSSRTSPIMPPLAGHRVQWKEADAGQLGSGPVAVELSEQLIAAADRQQGGSRLQRPP